MNIVAARYFYFRSELSLSCRERMNGDVIPKHIGKKLNLKKQDDNTMEEDEESRRKKKKEKVDVSFNFYELLIARNFFISISIVKIIDHRSFELCIILHFRIHKCFVHRFVQIFPLFCEAVLKRDITVAQKVRSTT